eukprot:m.31249 g.31249  ORF g.31249 m.31249 type:complete len:109 (+) comp4786_c0_seq1:2737-3063(+)
MTLGDGEIAGVWAGVTDADAVPPLLEEEEDEAADSDVESELDPSSSSVGGALRFDPASGPPSDCGGSPDRNRRMPLNILLLKEDIPHEATPQRVPRPVVSPHRLTLSI